MTCVISPGLAVQIRALPELSFDENSRLRRAEAL